LACKTNTLDNAKSQAHSIGLQFIDLSERGVTANFSSLTTILGCWTDWQAEPQRTPAPKVQAEPCHLLSEKFVL
ncbi:MAG: hypothetical protein AAF385_16110, partial [Pseudomonadota bacterium]